MSLTAKRKHSKKMKINNADQIKNQIVDILKPTQVTAAVHQKNSILLKKLYENTDNGLFLSAFKKILFTVLIADCGNAFIERTMNFLATFCSVLKPDPENCNEASDYNDHPLLSKIFLHLLETSELENTTVRFRSCQLINKILNNLVGSDVSSMLCDKLEEYLLIRLRDPKNIVRQQAVLALHRLQDPSNPEDEVIPELVYLMTSDSYAKVRLLCIEKIAIRTDVVKHIVNRIRDVDINVRIAAYKRLSNFTAKLQISQRRHILHCGFLDASEKVLEFVTTNIIPKWLEHYEDNILSLMKSVRLDADEKDIEETLMLFQYILKTLFKSKPIVELSQVLKVDDTKLLPMEALNWETACYWRSYVEFLSKYDELEDELDKVIPELVSFCKYVKEYYSTTKTGDATVEYLEKQFILKQMFLIIKTYDCADVASRDCLNSLVSNTLEKVDLMSDVIDVVVKCLENSIPEINSRSRFVSEIISEIMFPLDPEVSQEREREKEFELCKIMVKLNCLVEEQNQAIAKENFSEAERLKKEISEMNIAYKELKNSSNPPAQVQKKTDVPTIIRYLDVAAGLLVSPQVTGLNPTLRTIKDDVIQELLMHNNDNVRAKALRCYALYCIVDKECASTGIHIFSTPIFAYQNGEECDTQTLIICIGAVVDLIHIYGPQLMAAPRDEVLSASMEEAHERVFAGGTSLTDLVQGLVDLMDDEQYEIQEKAVWGLCQLMLVDRIQSPSLLSRLILKWCSPASEGYSENDGTKKLSQIIGYTLEKVPATATADQLEQAVLMTIKVLVLAPRISPLSNVNIDNIAHFMVALCKTSPKAIQIQANLAMKICVEIKDKPKSRLNATLSKMLLLLDIHNDKLLIRDLLKICDQIRDESIERPVLNNFVKFVANLERKRLDCSTIEERCEEERNLVNISEAV